MTRTKTRRGNVSRSHARARKRFLHLAAIAFALGSQTLAARVDGAPGESPGTTVSPDGSDANDGFQHRLPLSSEHDSARAPARIEVIALGHSDAFGLAVSGSCCIGPLPPGPYVVRATQGQLVETHLLRFDGGSGDHLVVGG